jgi:hypothetical protein
MAEANVIRPASYLPRYTKTDFPAYFWNQDTGEQVLVTDADSIPAGCKPYHPKSADLAKPPAEKPTAPLPMTKAEVVAHLKAGEVEHKTTASHASLYELLLTSVKAALAEAKIAFDPASTDAKALLELFPKA